MLTSWQVGATQFSRVCSRVLSRCSSVMASGWQQVSVVYLTLSQMSRQVDSAQPQGQPAGVVAGRLYRFTRDYMTDVGLDTWIHDHGGLGTVLEHNMVCTVQVLVINTFLRVFPGNPALYVV
jgi:hypothetical protein